MQTYELLVKERSVRPNSKDMTLVRTSIGIDQVHILFDNAEWLGFPITVTFAQGNDVITVPVTVTELRNSEWVAETTVTVPYEVIDMVGSIRVTLQGTDAQGNHIITAKGSPLSVEEAGDVIEGLAPADAPTVSEWQQAYSDAQVAIGQAQALVDSLTDRLDEVVEDAIQRISHEQYELPVATDEVLGGVKIGSGIGYRDDGTIFVTQQGTSSTSEKVNARLLSRIAEIVDATITATYDDDGISGTSVSHESLPIATMETVGVVYPDGTSVVVDDDGMIHAEAAYVPVATNDTTGSVKPDGTSITIDEDGTIHGSMSYELPIATTETLGGVRPDGETIVVDGDGVMSASRDDLTDEQIIALTPIDSPIPDGDEMSF